MLYEIDYKKYEIKVIGTSEEIKKVINCLDIIVNNGAPKRLLKDDLDHLEKIVLLREHNFNHVDKICFDSTSLTYYADVETKHYGCFSSVKENFERALKLMCWTEGYLQDFQNSGISFSERLIPSSSKT